jgi:hypothetical protein
MPKLTWRFFSAALTLSLIVVLTLGLSRASYGGQWVLDSYIYSGSIHSDTQAWSSGSLHRTVRNPFYNEAVDRASITGGQGVFNTSASLTLDPDRSYGGTNSGAPSPNGWPVKAGKTSVAITVRPVFAWQRGQINDPETGTYLPDPTDNPNLSQRIYVLEDSTATVFRTHSNNSLYSLENPFRGAWMPLEDLSNGLKSPIGEPEMLQDRYGQFFPEGVTQRCSGSRVRAVTPNKLRRNDQGREVFDGPAIHITGLVRIPNYFLVGSSRASADLSFSYEARIVRFEISARRKGSVPDPKVLAGFGGYASIAAGHKLSDEHQAEVLLKATVPGAWGVPTGLAGIPLWSLPKLRLHSEKGVEKDAKLLPPSDSDTPANEKPADHTDNSGYIIINRVLSRDLTTLITGHTYVTLADNVYNPSAQANHAFIYQNRWEKVEWKMGENGEKPWKTDFYAGNADSKEKIWANAVFGYRYSPLLHIQEDVPLTKHTVKFVVNHLAVRERDDNGVWVNRVYTSDPNDRATNYSIDTEFIYQADLDVSRYVKFSPPTAIMDAQGVVKSEMTIIKDPNRLVTKVVPGLEDQDVYQDVYQSLQ